MYSPETAISYHERTKHHFHQYAQSPGRLDWANQPDPFRRFAGAPLVGLAFPGTFDTIPYDRLLSMASIPPQPVNRETLSAFLLYSLGLSAWKAVPGDRWPLRCNPSSGNLHPTEGYVAAGGIAGLGEAPGLYHYAPREHGLERRANFSAEAWRGLLSPFPEGAFLVGLTSVHWREAWKYGERAYRYCCHDVGHALAALSLSAAVLGWRVCVLGGVPDGSAARLLGVDRDADFVDAERETADLLAVVVPWNHRNTVPGGLDKGALDGLNGADWFGQANRLSREHVDWPVIDEVAGACEAPSVEFPDYEAIAPLPGPADERAVSATSLFTQRRSAMAMDGRTSIDQETFLRMLSRVMPSPGTAPWWSMNDAAAIHLVLFVHRVRGLPPGLYLLLRNMADEQTLRAALRDDVTWEAVAGSLPLYRLCAGDFRETAMQLSCGQEIAGDGAFAVGMLGRFAGHLRRMGAHVYPRLYWEAGMVGQMLYLEAEAAGIRGTGIGCYFDDAVHTLLGLRDNAWQSMYHFTVGGPVEDHRLMTLPPYDATRHARK